MHQRFPSAIRLKLFELSFAMEGAVLHRMVMMPMMSMPVFYMAPAPQHMNLMCILRQMFQKSQPYAKRQECCGRANESDNEVYYHLLEAYENPGAWRRVEEGLAIRSTKLPALKTCYVEKNVSDYVHRPLSNKVFFAWPWHTRTHVCCGSNRV